MTGRPAGVKVNVLPDETSNSKSGILIYNIAREEMSKRFWTIWSSEYVKQLPPWHYNAKGTIAIGSVVLIREDGCSRHHWPLAVVTKLFPDKDVVVRAVNLKSA